MFLVADFVTPGPGFGEIILSPGDLEICLCQVKCILGVIQIVFTHRFRVQLIRLLLLVQLILGAFEASVRVLHLSFGDFQIFLSRLGLELFQEGQGGLGLGFLLGGLIGARIATGLPDGVLEKVFAIALLVVSLKMLFAR